MNKYRDFFCNYSVTSGIISVLRSHFKTACAAFTANVPPQVGFPKHGDPCLKRVCVGHIVIAGFFWLVLVRKFETQTLSKPTQSCVGFD